MTRGSTSKEEPLAAALLAFVNLRRWSDRRRFLRRHGELLSPHAIDALGGQLAINYANNDLDAVVLIEIAMTTLANAMSRGVQAATSPPGLRDDELIPPLLSSRLGDLDATWDAVRRSANPRFLYEAVALSRSVVQLVSEQIPYLRARTLNICGEILYRAYQATSAPGTLTEAATYFEEALTASHPSSPDLPVVMNSLGIVLRTRARLKGTSEDLQEALRLFTGAAAGARARGDTRNHRIFLANAGNAEMDFYSFTGEIAKIGEVVDRYKEALSLYGDAGEDRFDQRAAQTSLGNALLLRFQFTAEPKDLSDALYALRTAAKYSAGLPDEPGYLANLARSLDDAHSLTGDEKFMDQAVEAAAKASAGLSDTAVIGPTVRSGLAGILVKRYRARQEIADLDEAVSQLQNALASVPETGSERPSLLGELAGALALRSENAAARSTDRRDATSTYRTCCDLAARINPAVALTAGRSWGDWALGRQAFDEAVEAYRCGSTAAHDLFRAQPVRSHQEDWLMSLQGMPENRAYACGRVGHSEEAAAAMEGDRALLLSTALQLHTAQLDELRSSGAGELSNRYEACVQRLTILQRLQLESRFDATPP